MFLTLTIIALVLYLVSCVLFLAALTTEHPKLGAVGRVFIAIGLVVQLGALSLRVVDVGPGALVLMPDGMALVAALTVAGYLALDRLYAVRPVGSLVAPLAAIALVAALPRASDAAASESGLDWLLRVHVSLAFLGTVAFALAFMLALAYATQDYQLRSKRFGVLFRRLPALDGLENASYRCIQIGFPIYTVAILLGFVRAAQQHGAFAKTNTILALVTWLFYGLVIQARLTAGWRGRKAAWITIAGFLTAAGVVVFYVVR